MLGTLNDNPVTLYGVFAYARLGVDRELLAIYSTPARAQALVDAQSPGLQMWMRVEEVLVDRDPRDEFWRKPSAIGVAIAELEAGKWAIPRWPMESRKNRQADRVPLRASNPRPRRQTLLRILRARCTRPGLQASRLRRKPLSADS